MEYTIYRKGEPITFESSLTVGQAAGMIREDLLKKHNTFKASLLASYEGRGLSATQEAWLIYLAQEILSEEKREIMQEFGEFKEIVDLFNNVELKRFSVKTEKLILQKCSDRSSNKGGLWVKDGYSFYVGKITPLGDFKCADRSPRVSLEDLREVASDPLGAALRYGKETNSCSCCGRPLSDEVSVFGGIGPVCLSRLAGPAARRELEKAFKESDAANLSERLMRAAGWVKKTRGEDKSPAPPAAEIKREDYKDENDYNLANAISLL